MRKISQTTLDLLAKKIGLEPINIVEVQWKKDVNRFYSDRAIEGLEGKILELAGLESVINLDGNANSTSVKVRLDDVDGDIKNIFDNNDIHARPVKVYQWFNGIPLSEKFIIFEGHIASPIEWKEGDRTLSFDILSKLEDLEVGFSIEEGDFSNIPPELIGKAWPMIFGTVLNSTTLQIDQIPSGTTLVPIGIPDSTLQGQADYVGEKIGEQIAKANCYSLAGSELQFQGQFQHGGDELVKKGNGYQRQAATIIQSVQVEMVHDRNRIQTMASSQKQYDVESIPIANGHKFPQGVSLTLDINGAKYTGIFQYDIFKVASRQSPDDPIPANIGGQQLVATSETLIVEDTQENDDKSISQQLNGGTSVSDNTNTGVTDGLGDPCSFPNLIINKNPAAPTSPPKAKKFFFANAGASVKISGAFPIRHIVSIIQGTTVIQVSARRTVGGFKVLAPVPPQFYIIQDIQYGNLTVKMIILKQQLSTIKGADWEDEIFATIRSPVGPNIVDIIRYLIDHYSQFDIDETSFAYVRAKVAAFPANFALYERKNIVTLLKDIAFQARCAIWINNGIFFLKYLPEDVAEIDTITEDDIETGSMTVYTTETEDLVTKFIATWKPDLALNDYKIVLRYNIAKYGLHEKTYNFFIYNSQDLVLKAATFWLIRMSNTWKKMKCKVFLTKLKIETLDTVLLNFQSKYISNGSIRGVVEKATFNSADYSIDLDIWTPVRLGEMVPNPFAYPSDISAAYVYPIVDDVAGGFVNVNNSGATGDIGNTSNTQFIQSGKGGSKDSGVNPTDQGFSSAPVITTATDYSRVPEPVYDVKYKTYKDINKDDVATVNKSMPGKIVALAGTSGEGTAIDYIAKLYPYGLNNDSISVTVTMLDQDESDSLAVDSWWMFSKMTWFEDGNSVTKYYFQYPIWSKNPNAL